VSTKGKAIKAVLDARHVPFDLFGRGHAAHLRKLIFLYISTFANPDGTEAYPALETIAKDCGLTIRGLSKVLRWLKDYGLVTIKSKASHLGTNKYALALTEELLAEVRLKLDSDGEQAILRGKAVKTRRVRSEVAKARWEKKRESEQKIAEGDLEHSVPGGQSECVADMEHSVLGDTERSVLGQPGTVCIPPGTVCMVPGTQRSNDRPLDRPKNRNDVPSSPPSVTELDGWLDGSQQRFPLSGKFKNVLQNLLGKVSELTKRDRKRLDALPATHGDYGHLKAMLGVYEFTKREKGFIGITAPAALFLENADEYVQQSCDALERDLEEHSRNPRNLEWVRAYRTEYFGETSAGHDERIAGIAGLFEFGGTRLSNSKILLEELKARNPDTAFNLFLTVGPYILKLRREAEVLADEDVREQRLQGAAA
jgi:hypothetical protein